MPTWVVIIFAVLMVAGSVAWVRPSPRDKRLAEWRRDAIVSGLKVRLEGIAAEPKDSGIREDIEGVSYILYNPSAIKTDKLKWFVVKYDGWIKTGLPEDWSWHQFERAELADKISSLIKDAPLPILAIERTPNLSRIVWKEIPSDFDANILKSYLLKVQAIS